MKEIVALAVEDPYARKTLRECQGTRYLTGTTASTDPEIKLWAPRALFAVEDVHVHDLWSSVIAEPASRNDLQGLCDNRVADEGGQFAELAQTLKYVSSVKCFALSH